MQQEDYLGECWFNGLMKQQVLWRCVIQEKIVLQHPIDNLKFIRGAYLGEHVVIIGRVTYVGNTSMEVRVDTYVEDKQGMRRPINRAYLTMVALDENDHPIQIPGLIIETEEQRGEWEAAQKRREMRELRRKEGF